MRAIQYILAALASIPIGKVHGFYGYDAYHDTRRNYYELVNHCEAEGGECISVDFGEPDPSTTPEPTPPPTDPPVNPPTRLVPIFIQMWQKTNAPNPPTQAPNQRPRPLTRAPRTTTQAPVLPTKAPRPATRMPRPITQLPTVEPQPGRTKSPRRQGQRRGGRRVDPEFETLERKKRAIWGPGPFDYLYSECPGGWEVDFGCSAKGSNVCCYTSNSGY